MEEKDWKSTWKGRIAEHLVSLYNKEDFISEYLFNLNIDELLWHATTMIIGGDLNNAGDNPSKKNKKMVNIKIVGQRYWSKKAIEQYCKNNPKKDPTTGKTCNTRKCVDELRHEHAVPRIMIKDEIVRILKTNKKEADKVNEIYNLIRDYSKSVILTKDENGRLGKENKTSFTIEGEKITKLDSYLRDKLETGDKVIEKIKEYRYNLKEIKDKKKIEIIDLKKHENNVPYNAEKFKTLIHKVNLKIKNN